MITKEVYAKTILSKSKVADYTINPYIGCEHACTYCYARFMKRYTGHKEEWGKFVDVKINAPSLLRHEIKKKPMGRVWISGVCDPYQSAEKKFNLTKECLEILLEHNWPVTIQTKSPLVHRDLHLIKEFGDIKVGFSFATADEKLKKYFEPYAPSITSRIETLGKLHSAGIATFAMIAPLLPNAERLIPQLEGKTDNVLVDRMNYHYADKIYKRLNLESSRSDWFFNKKRRELTNLFKEKKMKFQFLY